MGYCSYRNRILNDELPLGRRCKNLLDAIESYAWLTECSFSSVLEELQERCGFRMGAVKEAQPVVEAFQVLDAARREFLEALASYQALRRTEKRAGQRIPDEEVAGQLYRWLPLGETRRPLR